MERDPYCLFNNATAQITPDLCVSLCITICITMYHYVCQFLELVAKCLSPDMGRSRESREKVLGTGVSMEASFDAG